MLRFWNSRMLSLGGRIIISKTLAISRVLLTHKSRTQAHKPRTRSSAPFTFLRPPAQITCPWHLTMELLFYGAPASKITFSRPLVTKDCHVFFYSFKQNSTRSLFENSFQQKVLSNKKPVNFSVNRLAVFYMMQIESYF